MKKETSIKRGKGNPSKTKAKRSSLTKKSKGGGLSDGKTVSVTTGTLKRQVPSDLEDRFVERANEHMRRAWETIYENGWGERKVN